MSDPAENPPITAAAQLAVPAGSSPSPVTVSETPLPFSAGGRRVSVVLKLTLLVGFTLAFLLAVLVTANALFWRANLRKALDARLKSIAASRSETIRAQVALLRQRAEISADRGEMRGFLYEETHDVTGTGNREWSQQALNRIADHKTIIDASLADQHGRIVLSTDPAAVGRNVADEPEFRAGLKDSTLGLPRRSRGRYLATLAAPVRNKIESDQVLGTLLTTADVSDLARATQDTTGLGETGETILARRDGNELQFLFPPRHGPAANAIALDSAPALKAATEGTDAFARSLDYRGVPVIAAGHPIDFDGWTVVAKMDEREAYNPIAVVFRLEVLAGLGVTALGLVAAYILARNFTRPMRDLAQAALRITQGDYETKVPVKSADEFAALSTTFNEMMTAIHARREERDHAAHALRNADRRKDEFLAMLGHELRNPLSAIANAVRLWSVAGNDPSAVELARSVIERQTGNLSRLVDDLLDVSRITEGKIELRKHPVDVSEAIRRAVQAVQTFADERRHEIEIELAENRLCVEADPTRLEQIITNLLTNAIKYTRKGGIIRITTAEEGSNAVISVSDTGIGIAPRMLPHIFDLFTQADRSLDRTTGGLGIGLALCRRLVEMHGGTITAASEGVGRGSTFVVRLPVTTAPITAMLPESANHPVPVHRQRRILLVDDNQDTVHSLARLLSLRGHEVATAFDGVAALKLAQEFQPDFLLLDLGLPGLDGFELARRLRAEGFQRTPIVAISGYAQENDRNRAREAGFNYHFAKPVDFEALAELILEDPLDAE
jgi:signal transduction histidine kinase/ActR/RegA family two-component response regulator